GVLPYGSLVEVDLTNKKLFLKKTGLRQSNTIILGKIVCHIFISLIEVAIKVCFPGKVELLIIKQENRVKGGEK
ncbi:MAG: hypothetical protein IIY08_08395, partial [Cellulosilyticum sp.]|nr:hypothetical protein [Cellulosilyticum sp.]